MDALDSAFHNILSDDFKVLLDDDEQSKIVSMQDDRNNYRPQKPLTGFIDHSSDDSDSDTISATTVSKVLLCYLYYLLCFQILSHKAKVLFNTTDFHSNFKHL